MSDTESAKAQVRNAHFILSFNIFVLIIFFVSGYSFVDFFRELPEFVVKAGPVLCELYGSDWENRLQVLLPKLFFIYSFILLHHFANFCYSLNLCLTSADFTY